MAQKLSLDDVRQLVRAAILSTLPPDTPAYVYDLYDDAAVYGIDQPNGTVRHYRVPYEIDDDGKVTLGQSEEVRQVRTWETIKYTKFTAGHIEELADGSIEVTAKLFTIGDYPDKGFGINEAEADEAVTEIDALPAPVIVEHMRSVFTHADPFNVGKLAKVWREGLDLFGKIRFSGWVKDALKGQAPKLSLGWSQHPKRIVEVSLVLDPRVEDAGLLAAFSSKPARIGGAMKNFWAGLKGLLNQTPDEELAQFGAAAPGSPAHSSGVSAEQVGEIVTQKLAEFKASLGAAAPQAATDGQLDAAVATFTAEIKAGGRVPPAAVEAFSAQYRQALLDDNGGTVVFSAGRPAEGLRAAALRQTIAGLPKVGWTEELVNGKLVVMGAETKLDEDGVLPVSVSAEKVFGKGGKA
ncbi:MAG: hypothetical protein KIT11_05465 [Fimbriimonadaceae bacterium]|nr:hypothetical protein [Fimbriimonadaceae bacterium]QYK56659.1 MAG: hypothetical protein KF733_04055 [Fimbriimonadaceae bacterium]